MLACNKQHYLNSFYGLVPSGVTPEANPLLPVKCLARAHRTPLVNVRVPYGLPHSPWRTFYIQPLMEYKRHGTLT
jgi:hypothetical protein